MHPDAKLPLTATEKLPMLNAPPLEYAIGVASARLGPTAKAAMARVAMASFLLLSSILNFFVSFMSLLLWIDPRLNGAAGSRGILSMCPAKQNAIHFQAVAGFSRLKNLRVST